MPKINDRDYAGIERIFEEGWRDPMTCPLVPLQTRNNKVFFKVFLTCTKRNGQITSMNLINLQTRVTSLFYPRGKKALTFSFDTDTFMAPRGPSVSVVMGGVRWGIYSRTALFQGGAYFKITFLTIWNLTLNQLIANAVNTKYSNSIFKIALLKHRQRLSDNSSRRKTWSTPDTDPIKL